MTKIEDLPWAQLATDIGKEDTRKMSAKALDVIEAFSAEHNLKYRTELYPQLLATVAAWGHDSDLKRLLKNALSEPKNLGIFYFLTSSHRAIPSQYKTPQYSKATPLFLAAHKLYNNIPYESWRNVEGLALVTGFLTETMFDNTQLTKSRLVELREIGLKVKTGNRVNQYKDSRTTYGLFGLQGTELDKKDHLTKMMLCQTWCYHPANRHSLMVTQSENWDEMPQALVNDEVFAKVVVTKPKTSKTEPKLDDLPWG